MANLRGAGAPRGQGRGRGRGRGRRPRTNLVVDPEQPVQEPTHQTALQEALAVIHGQGEMLDEQRAMIEELRAERQAERQARHEEEERNAENKEENEEDDRQTEEAERSERSQSPPPRPPRDVNTSQYWVTQFCKLNPPAFQGKLETAEDWLKKLEKIFGVMECPENRKAQLAIYKLEGDADRWWEVMAETLRTRYCPVTWEKFLEKFNEQYFPPSIKVTKETEFLHIRQGHEETINDYFARFTNLSRYSSHLRQNGDESSMANILIHGLKYEIKERLVSQRFTELIQAVESCRIIERNLKELRRPQHSSTSSARRNESNRGSSSRKREAPWSDSQRESKRPFQSRQLSNSRMQETRPCPKCRDYHPGVACERRRFCYQYRKLGHFIVDCPEKPMELRPQNPGRMYALTNAMDRELPERVQGTISLSKEFSLCIA